MSNRVVVISACGHWWRESRPEGLKVDLDQPRVCALCKPSHRHAVGTSPQGLGLFKVVYLDGYDEVATLEELPNGWKMARDCVGTITEVAQVSELRIWGAPPEPEDVIRVTDRYGCPVERRADGWWWTDLTLQPRAMPWSELFWTAGPLAEVQP